MKKISLLGATGSIGENTLKVLACGDFTLGALTAHQNVEGLAAAAKNLMLPLP
jgi:1-deoxy-D-xylulose 5-phosphate reductoisomerase